MNRLNILKVGLIVVGVCAMQAFAGGSLRECSIVVGGRVRTFLVEAPEDVNDAAPVVFVFHGGGGKAQNIVRLGFGKLAREEKFIAVYPDAFNGHWNDGRNASGFRSQRETVDDVAFVRAILERVAAEYKIDRSRVFAAGVSNGGIFCHRLAAEASDVFAAIAPVIGGMAEPLARGFKPGHPVSLLIIQGDADPLIPVGGGRVVGGLVDRGRIIGTEETIGKYLKLDGIGGAPTVTPLADVDPDDGTVTEVKRYPPGPGGHRVEVYMIHNGGHAWPGRGFAAMQRLFGKTSGDFDGAEVIWQFFKSCPPRTQP